MICARCFFCLAFCGSCLSMLSLFGSTAQATLEFVSDDAAHLWPDSAPVRTSNFELAAATRGVRGNRLQYQTFEVAEAFSLDRILIQYGWVGGTTGGSLETNFTKVRLIEIERTFNPPELEDAFTEVGEVIPQISFVVDPADKEVGTFYAIELAWDIQASGELILPARTGSQAYALEFNGTHDGGGSSAINLIERGTNPYPVGRAYEFQNGGHTGPFGTGLYDFPVVLTAVPAPGIDGDFNEDGSVDAADYVVWRKTLGDPTSYSLWRNNFGSSASGHGGGPAVVPEPHSIVLLISASICLLSLVKHAHSRRQ